MPSSLTAEMELHRIVGEIIDEWTSCGGHQVCAGCLETPETKGPRVCDVDLPGNLHVTFHGVSPPHGGADHPIVAAGNTDGFCSLTISTLKNQSYRLMYVGTAASMSSAESPDPLGTLSKTHVYILADSKPVGSADYIRGSANLQGFYSENYNDANDVTTSINESRAVDYSTVVTPYEIRQKSTTTVNGVPSSGMNVATHNSPHPFQHYGLSDGAAHFGGLRIWRGKTGGLNINIATPKEKSGVHLLSKYGKLSMNCEHDCKCVAVGGGQSSIWANESPYSGTLHAQPAVDYPPYAVTGTIGFWWHNAIGYEHVYLSPSASIINSPYFPYGFLLVDFFGGIIPYIPGWAGAHVLYDQPAPLTPGEAAPSAKCSFSGIGGAGSGPGLGWTAPISPKVNASETYSGVRVQNDTWVTDPVFGGATITITGQTDWLGSLSVNTTGVFYTDINFYQQCYLVIVEGESRCTAYIMWQSGAYSRQSGKGSTAGWGTASGNQEMEVNGEFSSHREFSSFAENNQQWERAVTDGGMMRNVIGSWPASIGYPLSSGNLPNITIQLHGVADSPAAAGFAVVSL